MISAAFPETESDSRFGPVPEDERRPLGLYVHIPFCEKMCPYCDFNTFARLDRLHNDYVEALCVDIQRWGGRLNHPEVDTLFLGGGTPTLLKPSHLEAILTSIHNAFRLTSNCEVTSEANPDSADSSRFRALRRLGVNRISLGIQSFDSNELRFLGRVHDRNGALRAIDAARDAGFTAINLDLIFGLPEQALSTWEASLKQALHLRPEHLSLYSLIVEPTTPLHRWVESGTVSSPDEEQAAQLYERAIELLQAEGYLHYEVSNWALDTGETGQTSTPQHASHHNLIYWRNQEYLGLGPGAHSHLRHPIPGFPPPDPDLKHLSRRWGGRRTVPDYIRRISQDEPIEEFCEWIDPATAMGESMMLGLRLVVEGVERSRFERIHGVDLLVTFEETIERFAELNLLEISAERVRLTPRGLMLANSVSSAFLP